MSNSPVVSSIFFFHWIHFVIIFMFSSYLLLIQGILHFVINISARIRVEGGGGGGVPGLKINK